MGVKPRRQTYVGASGCWREHSPSHDLTAHKELIVSDMGCAGASSGNLKLTGVDGYNAYDVLTASYQYVN